ncbi:MAG: amidase [Mucilaginibacter polytrichastri]|nr:amidase [Mucilaginibacter polytrichastri]
MRRRQFLRTSSFATFSLAFMAFPGCSPGGKHPERSDGFFPGEKGIGDLQKAMADGTSSAEKLTQFYLDEISRIDKKGPALNAVIKLNPDALSIARKLDEERKSGKLRGPMHGIPILIKDNIDTADKMQTTAGALAMAGNIAGEDAFIVKKLRDAGAVILGKTNLSEWANFRSTRSSSGWSSRGGQTHNPYVLDRSPCGSSSGSAVAVAANLCAVAVGTETDGSIACPASMNNVVGIKPTVGLLSRAGIIPISSTQDTAGPFGRTARDAALLLSAMTGADPDDAVTAKSVNYIQPDYSKFLDASALKGKRIGIDVSLKKHEGIDALFGKAMEQMKKAGAEFVEVDFMKPNNDVGGAEFTVLQYEFKAGLNAYLEKAKAPVRSLADVIRFNKEHAKEAMPYFQQETLESSQAKGDLKSREYTDALAKSTSVRGAIDKILKEHRLDALLGPATGTPWCIDPVNGDFWTGYGGYGPAAVAGYPSVTVPMGFLDGLPAGLSFIASAWEEGKLIALAYAYEQVSKNRKAPGFKRTVITNQLTV